MDQKACSICGKTLLAAEFRYGNRENRSYCHTCNKAEKAAYSAGGKESARQFRDELRAKWQH